MQSIKFPHLLRPDGLQLRSAQTGSISKFVLKKGESQLRADRFINP